MLEIEPAELSHRASLPVMPSPAIHRPHIVESKLTERQFDQVRSYLDQTVDLCLFMQEKLLRKGYFDMR